jgi:large subunit ribosomal protein L25
LASRDRCYLAGCARIIEALAPLGVPKGFTLDNLELMAEPRSVLGKKVRFLRRDGLVPANIYGHAESSPVQVNTRESERVLARAGKTRLVTLTANGSEPTTVLVKDFQRHPIKGSLLHIDFYRVSMTERIRVDAPIRISGEAPGVKQHNATLLQQMSTVSVESLPAELPELIEVDVSGLEELESAVYVRDIRPPAGVVILSDPDEMIVRLLPPTVEEVVEEPAEAEVAPTAEGEQPAEGTAQQPAEE